LDSRPITRIHLPESLEAELWVYAREAFPEEACGFLLGKEDESDAEMLRVTQVRLARNLHPRREDRFFIDPIEYQKAEKYCLKRKEKGLRILGIWHPHPHGPAVPSQVDLEHAQGLFQSFRANWFYLILSLRESEEANLRSWRPDDQGLEFLEINFK